MIAPEERPAGPSPVSPNGFYAELKALAEQGLSEPSDPALLERIESLVLRDIPELRQTLARSEAQLLPGFVETIADLGRSIRISDFEDDRFVAAFGYAWGQYLDGRLRKPVAANFLVEIHAELAGRSAQAGSALAEPRRQRQNLFRQLSARELSLSNADFKQRRETVNEITLLRTRASETEQNIVSEEMDALRALLPPETPFENLPANPPPLAFTPEKFHASAISALMSWGAAARAKTPFRLNAVAHGAGGSPLAAAVPPPAIAAKAPEAPSPEPRREVPEDIGGKAGKRLPGVLEPAAEAAPEPSAHTGICEEAVRRFREALEQRSASLGAAIENAAFHWIDRGYLNMAHAMLESAQASPLPIPGLLAPDLLKAVHFGMNTWSGDSEALAASRKLLDALSLPRLDTWRERQPSGPAVPYLIFAAAFQPAIFGGALTPAPALLEYLGQGFGTSSWRLIREILGVSLRNRTALSLAALRAQNGSFTERYASRLAALREEFEQQAREAGDFAIRASAKLGGQCIDNLLRAIHDEHSGLILDPPGIEASLALPRDMMAAVGFSGDAESQLAWLVERLS